MATAISPLAGKPAPRRACWWIWHRLEREYYERRPDLGRPGPAGQLRHQRASRLAAARHVHRSAHPGHHPGDLRLPAAARVPTARSTWARTRTRCPGRPSARRWRCWRPTAWRPSSSETTASRRRRSSRAPSWSTTADRDGAPGRRHRHHALAQPAGGRRLQIQPAQRRSGRRRRDRLGRSSGPTTLLRRRQRRRQTRAFRDAPSRPTRRTSRTS